MKQRWQQVKGKESIELHQEAYKQAIDIIDLFGGLSMLIMMRTEIWESAMRKRAQGWKSVQVSSQASA